MKKKIFTLLLILVLSCMSLIIIKPTVSQASGTIYIHADGSVDPLSAPISRDGNIYNLTSNIASWSICIQRNNVTIDGSGYILLGSGIGIGINITQTNNVAVKNITINNFDQAILIEHSSTDIITENNFNNNSDSAIRGDTVSNSIFSNNLIVGQGSESPSLGIFIEISLNNQIFNNNVNDTIDGIYLWYSSRGNQVYGNTANNDSTAIKLFITANDSIFQNTITNCYGNGIYIANSNYTHSL